MMTMYPYLCDHTGQPLFYVCWSNANAITIVISPGMRAHR